MLTSGKVAGKVILVSAPVPADVTLEWVLIAMATHVDGVEDVIREVDVAVGAVVEQLGVLGGVGSPWLAVGAAGGAGSLAAGARARTTATVCCRPWLWSDRGGSLGHAGRDCCRSSHWLLHEESGLLVG